MTSKLIISMTSWPKRIRCAAKAYASILMTSIDKSLYHCVLVLSEEEFPNKEKDLPYELNLFVDNNLIELIWVKENTKSHKKLMPTLEKYPNNPILIIDDDVIRTERWLKAFMNDHQAHPNDIIVGAFWKKFYVSDNLIRETVCMDDTYYTNKYCGKVMVGYKPANGTGGTLYPPGTFTDKRFFDKDLYMKLSPSSDETWQFCFNIIEGRTFRELSIPHQELFIEDSQKCAMNTDDKRYGKIYRTLFTVFPEFRENLIKLLR